MRLHLITVPYRYDDWEAGLGAGPGVLIDEGLIACLRRVGHEVSGPFAALLDTAERDPDRITVNVGRLGARTAALVASARRDGAGALVVAGDDTASIGVIAGLQQADGAETPIGVVWLDAHGDFNTPETSFSGILAGMPLAILAGLAEPDWRAAAGLVRPVPTARIVLGGVRELDEQEEALLRATSVLMVSTAELQTGSAFVEAVERLASVCSILALHVDLDVLDPQLVPSCSTPAASGLAIDEAAVAMGTVLRTGKVATVFISSLNPGGGERGRTSARSALALIEQALVWWDRTPGLPTSLGT